MRQITKMGQDSSLRLNHKAKCLAPLILIVLNIGCGSSNMAVVRGTVSYQGMPLEHGRVVFHPQEGRPAIGDIKDGRFELTTVDPGDGVAFGNYRVVVHSDYAKYPDDAFSDRVSLIPERYLHPETTPLTAEVKAGESNEFLFKLED